MPSSSSSNSASIDVSSWYEKALEDIVGEEMEIQRQFVKVDLPNTISQRIIVQNLTAKRHRLRHPILHRLMYHHGMKRR